MFNDRVVKLCNVLQGPTYAYCSSLSRTGLSALYDHKTASTCNQVAITHQLTRTSAVANLFLAKTQQEVNQS